MVQAFDTGKLQLRGDPVPVAEHVATTGSIGIFSVSPAGVLAYRSGSTEAAGVVQPTWFDRQGKATGAFTQPGPVGGLALSPDSTRAAGRDASQLGKGDVWVLDSVRGTRTRLTFHQGPGSFPIWSADGAHIIFSAGTSLDTIYERDASGAGEEKELLKKPGEIKFPNSVSHDGRFLLYNTLNTPKTGSDLWLLPLEGDRKPVLLLGSEFNEGDGSFSPDGRWIAYRSNESGRPEIYVRPFVAAGPGGPSLGEGKWQVSRDGAADYVPKWRNDGKELLFPSSNNEVIATDVNGGSAAFQMGTPQRLFTLPIGPGGDMADDAKRFLLPISPGQGQQGSQTPITVVLNWQADLKK